MPDLANETRRASEAVLMVAEFPVEPQLLAQLLFGKYGAHLPLHRQSAIYAREGVSHLSIVDPILRTLEVYRLEASRWVVASTHGGDEHVRDEPFEAGELEIVRWWLEG